MCAPVNGAHCIATTSTSTDDSRSVDETTSDVVSQNLLPSTTTVQHRPTMASFRRMSRINARPNARFTSQHFLGENLKLQRAQLAIDKQKLALQKRKIKALENIEKSLSSLPKAIEAVERELSILRQVYVVVKKVEIAMEQ